MEIKKAGQPVADVRRAENMAAAQDKQDALLEYVAMMADVEIPADEEDATGPGEVA